MAQYIRIVRKGKLHNRLELPDHTQVQVSVGEMSLWELVEPNEEVITFPDKCYRRILRKCKHNISVELPDYTSKRVPVEDFQNWRLFGSDTTVSPDVCNSESMDAEIAAVFSDTANPIPEVESVSEEVQDILPLEKEDVKPVVEAEPVVEPEVEVETSTVEVPVSELVNEPVIEPVIEPVAENKESLPETNNVEPVVASVAEPVVEIINIETQSIGESESMLETQPVEPVTEPVVEKPKSKRGRKPKVRTEESPSKPVVFRRNTNGLGVDHPYESVNMDCESVEYDKGIVAPF